MASEELAGYQASGIDGLVEHIFPDIALPCPLQAIYDHISKPGGKYLPGEEEWDACPNLNLRSASGKQEKKLAFLLKGLSGDIGTFVRTTFHYDVHPRAVTGNFAGGVSLPRGPPNTGRHPDLLFFEKGAAYTWENVVGCWELKNNSSSDNKHEARRQLAERALMIYESQDNRRFVPGVSVLGYQIILHVIDRAGEVSSAPFDMRTEPLLFLRLVVGFMFSGREYLGFDPNIKELDDGSRCITIKNKTYMIHQRLHKSHNLRGRGTSCWRATCEGAAYAIKDYWTDKSRASTEAKLLSKAKGVEGVPTLVAHDIITFNGKQDTTGLVRKVLDNPLYREQWEIFDIRVHRRLVLMPFAMPIYYFKTKKELIGAFIDTIQAHKDLLEKAKILHRDISISNLMLVAQMETGRKHRRGLLIDLDYATEYPEPEHRQTAQGARTGTTPFMALELLKSGAKVAHKPEWDLESFLYVLIWICVLYFGPCNRRRTDVLVNDTTLSGWLRGDFKTIWENKLGRMKLDELWADLLDEFAPYFEDLKSCISEWRAHLFQSSDPRTHDKVIAILRETYNKLPDEEEPFTDPTLVIAGPSAQASAGQDTALPVTPKRTRKESDFSDVNRREDVMHGGKRLRKDKLENAYYSEQLFPSGGQSSHQASLGSFAPTDAEEGCSSSASGSVEPAHPLRRTRRESVPSLKVRESRRS